MTPTEHNYSNNSFSPYDIEPYTDSSNISSEYTVIKSTVSSFNPQLTSDVVQTNTSSESAIERFKDITKTFVLYFIGDCVNVSSDDFHTYELHVIISIGSKVNISHLSNVRFGCVRRIASNSSENDTLSVSFVFRGFKPEFLKLKNYLWTKVTINPIFNFSGELFTLVRIVVRSEENARYFDDPDFKETLLLSVYIAISCSAGASLLVWLVFFVICKCRGDRILPNENVQPNQVRINVDKYDLRKIPRLNTDYVRGETMMTCDNNNFETSVIPFEDDVITISSQMHRRNGSTASSYHMASRPNSPVTEDMTMTPRQFRTFSRMETNEARPGQCATEMTTLEPRNIRPTVHFQGLENPLYTQP